MKYKVIIESLDQKVITPRTGRTRCEAVTAELPEEDGFIYLYYTDQSIESPGVRISIHGLEQLGDQYKFHDYEGRPFRMTVLNLI
jgi:hypothetical protein